MLDLSQKELEIMLQLLDSAPVQGRESLRLVLALIDKLEAELSVEDVAAVADSNAANDG